jgi:signal transduction histidine kinase
VFYLLRSYNRKQKINTLLVDRDELRQLEMVEIIRRLNNEINQHKLTQTKLEGINDELNNFMHRASHDLRSPLVSIIGLTNIALQDTTEKERIETLTMINQCTEKLRSLLNEMEEAAKVTYGNLKITSVFLADFINDVIGQLKNADYFKKVSVQILVNENLKINTDENLLRSIIQNLIDNGIKYSNNSISDSYVKIQAEWIEDELEITVSDNGQGIKDDHQAKVFDMFVRSNESSKGSGLGLYIVKKGVTKLGGKIEMKSKEGVGTTFNIFFPKM